MKITSADNLFNSELLFEWFGHLHWWWSWDLESNFDTVIDEPLEGGECTDHDDTWSQTVPHSHEAEFLSDVHGGRSLGLVQFGDDDISWMRDNGTENSSNITGSECDDKLFTLGAFCTWFRDNMAKRKSWVWASIESKMKLRTHLYNNSTVFSKQANFIIVYGICRHQSGTKPL